ncbi:aspartate-semialdehyde dehydrogenase [Moritella viscosa]|uniref:Aspartate-semialdehyde dehydrogenase n=1 Tax=Moritella viscosa TaxID=80854 RepID=A0A1K9ZS80_9GAMM|nr:aspartate-semialdehyde dehydrogenase [Moritella viscosa]SGY95515.1 Aspartate semialdehyde dehydrogenese [Moritella viscosa]SGZ01355.1 Aspartate semialdehyde dehydrogenese [Moritella viscosa]SGZ07529.1 Aspartate semialdehyde dehydrogenese [Moritella viscosa]SGZ07676.1 Aspartate semialdehyde dehydrogenese [Moritella viscosa]SHO09972.1 Aspartate semialdehyde dehydrogenese [Moritella viscosa]
MSQLYDVAVLGATGAVGQMMLEILQERKFPIGNIYPLASSRSAGGKITFNNKQVEVLDVDNFDWTQVQIGLFSAGGSVSEKWAPIAADAGVVVIDNTSQFRYDEDIPLVVPEVNPEAIAQYTNRGIIANPNCSTIQMLVALKPIHDAVGISRINVATYQAVSGSGKSAIDELAGQTASLLNAREVETKVYPKQIAFNVIPQIDVFTENGYTKEEMKMVWETQKIFGDEYIMVNPTAVRVPVFYGHSEAIHLETRTPISAEEVRSLMRHAPGVKLIENEEDYPTPVSDSAGHDDVFVGRIREDISHASGINMWVVGDNIRKGAATNSVQIAELLIRDYL